MFDLYRAKLLYIIESSRGSEVCHLSAFPMLEYAYKLHFWKMWMNKCWQIVHANIAPTKNNSSSTSFKIIIPKRRCISRRNCCSSALSCALHQEKASKDETEQFSYNIPKHTFLFQKTIYFYFSCVKSQIVYSCVCVPKIKFKCWESHSSFASFCVCILQYVVVVKEGKKKKSWQRQTNVFMIQRNVSALRYEHMNKCQVMNK